MSVKVLKFVILFAVLVDQGLSKAVDNLMVTKCTANCLIRNRDVAGCRAFCKKQMALVKSGDCPEHDLSHFKGKQDLEDYFRDCDSTCKKSDFECPELQKCCKMNACSYQCVDPEHDYQKIANFLPSMPVNVSLECDKKKDRGILRWVLPIYSTAYPILFAVESKNCAGPELNFANMENETCTEFEEHSYELISQSRLYNAAEYRVKVKLRAGRFYQFRIAAVNFKGTLGYIHSSYAKLDRGE